MWPQRFLQADLVSVSEIAPVLITQHAAALSSSLNANVPGQTAAPPSLMSGADSSCTPSGAESLISVQPLAVDSSLLRS